MYSLLLALALSAPPSLADTTAVEATLPEVSVVATRHAVTPEEAPARVTVLGREAITATGARSVAELLDARSSSFVRRYGPAGLASLSLRGTGASQTLVLLDGHRIADPQLGQVDLSLLPTILLERVEILHGAGSALHGSDAIGGVVDLRTLSGTAPAGELVPTLGAFGEIGTAGRVTIATGSTRGVVAAELRRSDGDFRYIDRRSGDVVRRAGADASHASLFGRAETSLGRATVSGAIWLGSADRGIPGSVGAPIGARQQDRHVRAWASLDVPMSGGSVRGGALLQDAALGYGGDEGRSTAALGEVELRTAFRGWMIATGAAIAYAAAVHPQLEADASQGRVGVYIAATGDVDGLLLYPALRADLTTNAAESPIPGLVLSPRLGLNWQPFPDVPLRLKAGAGSAFRAPTFNDRFWRYTGTDVGGDPDLLPERGWTADGGLLLDLPPALLELSLYASALRDQIVWLPGPGGLFVPDNIGRTRTLGAELSVDSRTLRLGSVDVEAGIAYALTDARDRSDSESSAYGRQLRYVPRHTAKAHVSSSWNVNQPTSLLLGVTTSFVSARPVRVDGSLDEPGHFVASARFGLAHSLGPAALTTTLTIENALNTDYVVMRGYPMPLRHARLSIKLSF